MQQQLTAAVPAVRQVVPPLATGGETFTPELNEVVAMHRRALYARALWLTKTSPDAADLTHDTIERTLRRGRRDLSPEATLRWMFAIMHNAFLDDRRARAVRRHVPWAEHVLENLPGSEPGEQPRWRMVDDQALTTAFARLPHDERELLRLQMSGASYDDLADALAIKRGTVGSRLFRARRRLRRLVCAAAGMPLPDAGDDPV